MLFLVTGITGNVGGATAQRLLERGHNVRALVRHPEKAAAWQADGVELVQGDLTDSRSVAAALAGTRGAFLMVPPLMAPQRGFPEARAVVDSYIAALRQAPTTPIVALSSIGSEKADGLGLITTTHMLETALVGMAPDVAFIRAGSFFENYVPSLEEAARSGHLYTFNPVDQQVNMVATRDIGVEAARLLTSDWGGTRIIELGTPTSANEVARAMSEVVGRHVTARAVPRDQWTSTLEQMGIPAGSTWAYEEMAEGINSGWIDFGAPGTEPLPASTLPKEVFAEAWNEREIETAR